MRKRRLLLSLFSVFFLLTSLSPFVLAEVLEDYWHEGVVNIGIQAVYPAAQSGTAQAGCSVAVNCILKRVVFSIIREGSPVGNVTAFVTLSSNMTDVVAWSIDAYSTASIGNTEYVEYSFDFDGSYVLEAGEDYNIGICIINATTINSSNHINLIIDTAVMTHDSAAYRLTGTSTWTVCAYDLWHEVYSTTESGTPDTPSEVEGYLGDIMEFIVPAGVTIAPVLLFLVFGGRGKWLILLGAAVGAGLGYTFGLVPMWLVFIIAIAIVGMAYQSVKGGGAGGGTD